MSAANAAAQTQADGAYAQYESEVAQAYSAYFSRYSMAYARVEQALADANAALTAAMSSADATLMSTVHDSVLTANTAWAGALAAFNGSLGTAASLYQTASEAAWDNGDIAAVDAAYAEYLDEVAELAEEFDDENQEAMDQTESTVTTATTAFETAAYAAERAWMAVMTAEDGAFTAEDAAAWAEYLMFRADAWDRYQASLSDITSQQQITVDGLWGTFQGQLGAATVVFTAQEAAAWTNYLASTQPGEPLGARLNTSPEFVVAQMPAAPPAGPPQPPLNQGSGRGQRPLIDWDRGRIVVETAVPWRFSPDSTGWVREIQIGTRPTGEPITIRAWQANAPLRIDLHYWCHGLTFFGGGPMSYSPFSGADVQKLLDVFYNQIPGNNARSGDIIVFTGTTGVLDHSCVILTPVFNADGSIDPARTTVRTKNGARAEATMTLQEVINTYPGTWAVYARK